MDRKCFCYIWNQRHQICLIPKFSLKNKIFKFGTKNVLLGYFRTRTWEQYCHIWKHHSRICLAAKFPEKMKVPEFGTQNALFGYFWARISKLWNQKYLIWVFLGKNLKKLLSYLKLAPSNLSNCKILQKNKNA